MEQNNTNIPLYNNPSLNEGFNIQFDENLRKTVSEQKEKHKTELEPLLNTMKQKMEEGSKNQSKMLEENNPLNSSNNLNFNSININQLGNLTNSKPQMGNNNFGNNNMNMNSSNLGMNSQINMNMNNMIFNNNINNSKDFLNNNMNMLNNNYNNMNMNMNNNNQMNNFNNMNNMNISNYSNNSKLMNMNSMNNSIHSNNNNIMNMNNMNNSIHSNNSKIMNMNQMNNSMNSNNNNIMNMNQMNNSINTKNSKLMNMNNSINSNNSKIMNMNNSIHSNNSKIMINNNNFNQNMIIDSKNILDNNFGMENNIDNNIQKNQIALQPQFPQNLIQDSNMKNSNNFQNNNYFENPLNKINIQDLNNQFEDQTGAPVQKDSKILINNSKKSSKIFNESKKSSKLLSESKKSSKLLSESKKSSKLLSESKMNNKSKNSKIIKNEYNKYDSKMKSSKNSNLIPTPMEKEQEKYDSIRKSQIIERHSVEMASYYDYTPDETEGYLNELLEDMNFYGEQAKKEIENQKKINPNKYMSIEEALEKPSKDFLNEFKSEYFVLGILANALTSQGCFVAIERNNPQKDEEIKEIYTTIQFLVNGMHNFKKYIFHFDFGKENNEKMLKNTDKQKFFNSKLRKKLKNLFNLKEKDIIMTNPRMGSYEITAIIKQSKFIEYSKDQLLKELKEDIEFSSIKDIEKSILLSGLKLNPFMLDPMGNNRDGGWGFNEKRGGHTYYPPEGWIGYGLRVIDRFDNGDNTWLDYRNTEGEWTVAYHGVGGGLTGSKVLKAVKNIVFNNLETGIRQQFKDSDDSNHPGKKVGEGVYVTPKPEIMDQYAGTFIVNNRNYKIGIMTRVKPEKIRCPKELRDYWIINGTDNEIRPYRILIKEI